MSPPQQASLTVSLSLVRGFLDVLAGVVKQSDDVMVVEVVERKAADPPNPYQSGCAKKAQLMGHCGLGQLHECGEVTDATFAM